MNPVQSPQTPAATTPTLQATQINPQVNSAVESDTNAQASPAVRSYGLPCAKCRTYYDSKLDTCPVCKTSKRVAVDAISVRTVTGETKDPVAMEQERRRLAQEFNSQAYAPALTEPGIETGLCAMGENHPGGADAATVCKGCYDRAMSRADLMEAALHIDLKEAAQVIYEAVWADPTDPTKTYQNAAQALLVELHKRAGISAVLSPIHPMAH